MQDTKYFEVNSEDEQVLSSTDEEIVNITDSGAEVAVSIVSAGESTVHTFDETEGFYRISPETHPDLIDELDTLFTNLNDSKTALIRNPYDGYELVVKQTEASASEESSVVNGQTNATYVLSPENSEGVLITLEDVFTRLAE